MKSLLFLGSLSLAFIALPAAGQEGAAPDSSAQAAPRLDLYGDPLPEGAIARMGTTRLRHGSAVTAVAFFPDGRTLASGDYRGGMIFWDIESGRSIMRRMKLTQPGRNGGISDIVISADGTTMAWGRNRLGLDRLPSIELWDMVRGRQTSRSYAIAPSFDARFDREGKQRLAFSADDALLVSAGNTATIYWWDPKTGDELGWRAWPEMQGGPDFRNGRPAGNHRADTYTDVAISPDGRTVAAVTERGPMVIARLDSDADPIFVDAHYRTRTANVAFSADGKKIYSGGNIEWWSEIIAETGREVIHYRGAVRIWDAETGRPIGEFIRAESEARYGTMALSPDGATLFVSMDDGSIDAWDTRSGRLRTDLKLPSIPYGGSASILALSADGRLLALTRGRRGIDLWDLEAGESLHDFGRAPDTVADHLYFLDGGKTLVSTAWRDPIRTWDVATGRSTGELQVDDSASALQALRFFDDGRILAVSGGLRGFGVWDLSQDRKLSEFTVGEESYSTLAFSPDGSQVAVSYPAFITQLFFGPGSDPEAVLTIAEIFDTATGESVRKFQDQARNVGRGNRYFCAFTPDGQHFVYSDSSQVYFWEARTGILRAKFDIGEGFDRAFDLTPDGSQIVSLGQTRRSAQIGRTSSLARQGDNAITAWDLATGDVVRRVEVDASVEGGLRVHPSGDYALALANDAQEIRFYDLRSGEALRTYGGDPAITYRALEFTPDGQSFAASASDGSILIFELPPVRWAPVDRVPGRLPHH